MYINPYNRWIENEGILIQIVQKRDLKEVFDWCYVPHPELDPEDPKNKTIDGFNRWPRGEQEFKSSLQSYFSEMTRCAFKLLTVFCKGLGIPPDSLHPIFENGIGFARMNFYERVLCADDNVNAKVPLLGINNHTDAGFLTILYQDHVPGLQVQHSGEWIDVPSIPGALTINVGDMCTVLTNGEFVAPIHRVIAPVEHRRYSVAFFFNPHQAAEIEPMQCFLTGERKAKYRPILWGTFRRKRFAGDYKDEGKEIQINDYVIPA